MPEPHQQFQPDDIMIKYCRFNTAPAADLLYTTLAKTGYGIIWGKIMAIVFFVSASTLLFITARSMYGQFGAWMALGWFVLLPPIFKLFSGGFMSAWSATLLILTVYSIHRRHWWYAPFILAVGALSYPMAAIQCGFMYALDALIHYRRHWRSGRHWLTHFSPLIMAMVMGSILVLLKYNHAPPEFGHLVNATEIGSRVEFTQAGRYPLLPLKSLPEVLMSAWLHIPHLILILLAAFRLRFSALKLSRGMGTLLLSGCILYVLAEWSLLKLYFPDRYLQFTLPFWFALASGHWLSRMWSGHSAPQHILTTSKMQTVLISGFSIIIFAGFLEFQKGFKPGVKTLEYHRQDLYEAILNLPPGILLAAHPKRGSELPLFTGRSVFVAQELTHPWWTGYWEIMSQRMRAFFRAYYATDPEVLREFIIENKIDYFVIQPHHFTLGYMRQQRQICFEPFNTWVRQEVLPLVHPLLSRIPERYWKYSDDSYRLIAAEEILNWLNWKYEASQNSEIE